MNDGRKNSLKYSSAWFLTIILLLTVSASANYTFKIKIDKPLTSEFYQDTVPVVTTDTIPVQMDSLASRTDTLGIKLSKDSITSAINYNATDSMVLDVNTKKIIFLNRHYKCSSTKLQSSLIQHLPAPV